MGPLDQLRGTNGDGMIDRARTNPWLAVAIAAGAILLLAWIGWAVYVTSENGAGAGLGVLIAWPAMLVALTLVSLPFVGGYLLIKRPSEDSGSTATAEATEERADEEGQDKGDAEEEEQEGDAKAEAAKS